MLPAAAAPPFEGPAVALRSAHYAGALVARAKPPLLLPSQHPHRCEPVGHLAILSSQPSSNSHSLLVHRGSVDGASGRDRGIQDAASIQDVYQALPVPLGQHPPLRAFYRKAPQDKQLEVLLLSPVLYSPTTKNRVKRLSQERIAQCQRRGMEGIRRLRGDNT